MRETDNCGTCRYWRPAWKLKHKSSVESAAMSGIHDKRGPDGGIRTAERGLCCRHAPRPSALTTVWMETKAGDWCGDHEPDVDTRGAVADGRDGTVSDRLAALEEAVFGKRESEAPGVDAG